MSERYNGSSGRRLGAPDTNPKPAVATWLLRQGRFLLLVVAATGLLCLAVEVSLWCGDSPPRRYHPDFFPWSYGAMAAIYAATAALIFPALVLTSAALQMRRARPIDLDLAIKSAAQSWLAVLGFAVIAVLFGAASDFLVYMRMGWIPRAILLAFGVSWALLLIAPTVVRAAEPTEAAAPLIVVYPALLVLPVTVLVFAGVWLTGAVGESWSTATATLAGIANLALLTSFLLFGRICVKTTAGETATGVGVVGTAEALAEAAPLPAAPPARPRRFAPFALKTGVVVGVVGWQVLGSGLFQAGSFSPAIAVNTTNFPAGPRRVASRRFVMSQGRLAGIASVATPAGPRVFLFGDDRLVELDGDLSTVAVIPVSAVAGSLRHVEVLELAPGKGVFVGRNAPTFSPESVTAIDWTGRVIFQRTTDDADGVLAIAPMRTGSSWGVAVGYNAEYGLCWLDSLGKEKWCNKDIHSVWALAAADCNGDGKEEIVSLSSAGRSTQRRLGCYGIDGNDVATFTVPRVPFHMRSIDLDLDSRHGKEIAYLDLAEHDGRHFGAFHLDGTLLTNVHAAPETDRWLSIAAPVGVRRRPGGTRDVVVIGPGGKLLGTSLTGQRWSAGSGIEEVTTFDLEGDGVEELVTFSELRTQTYPASEYRIEVWAWRPDGDEPITSTTVFDAKSAYQSRSIEPAYQPIRPFARPPGALGATTPERDFRLGCTLGVNAALAWLPKIAQRDPIARDLAVCDQGLVQFDVSRLDQHASFAWFGCHQGTSAILSKYQLGETERSTAMAAAFAACNADLRGKTGPLRAPDPGSAAAATDAADDVPPVSMPTWVLERLRLSDVTRAPHQLVLPAKFDHAGASYHARYEICVSPAGTVTKTATIRGTREYAIDSLWEKTMQGWTFRPLVVHDSRIGFCSSLFLEVDGHGQSR